jgi:hypothetical protein
MSNVDSGSQRRRYLNILLAKVQDEALNACSEPNAWSMATTDRLG